MPSLRPLKPARLVKILAKFGFTPLRQKGSHLVLKGNAGRTTVVPLHGNEEIDISLLRSILRECGIKLVCQHGLAALQRGRKVHQVGLSRGKIFGRRSLGVTLCVFQPGNGLVDLDRCGLCQPDTERDLAQRLVALAKENHENLTRP